MRDHGSPRPAGGGGDRGETMGLIGLLGGGVGKRPWVSQARWGGTELWWLIPWLRHQG